MPNCQSCAAYRIVSAFRNFIGQYHFHQKDNLENNQNPFTMENQYSSKLLGTLVFCDFILYS